MKIAIPSNDKETLAERSGRAKWFLIYKIENKEIVETKIKANNHEHHQHNEEHEHGHSHADMIQMLSDCDLMITKRVGPHFGKELKAANIKVEITQKTLISDVLKPFL